MSQQILAHGGASDVGRVIGPSLEKIIKNVGWLKNNHLIAACKATLEKLETATASDTVAVSEVILSPLLLAVETGSVKLVIPALDAVFRLFSLNLLRVSLSSPFDKDNSVVSQLIASVCKCVGLNDEAVVFSAMKVILAAFRSPRVRFCGEYLDYIVRICYDLYLDGKNLSKQLCAKAVLAQVVLIVFTRVEADSMIVNRFRIVSVSELFEFTDRNLSEGNSNVVQRVQSLINEVMLSNEVVNDEIDRNLEDEINNVDGSEDSGDESGVEKEESRLRADGFTLFKNLCNLSMKFSLKETSDEKILLRGKVLSLELLKMIMDNSGGVWQSNERFMDIVKKFLCLSVLKNSALTITTIFQLLCSIFLSLLSKFRSRLKAELGIFYPMLILRVLENVLQPNFPQKLTVLNVLEKISQAPQLIVDIYVNYDCDPEASNLYERTINGLFKTALGPPSGSVTSLSPVQDLTFRIESVKCLVKIVKSVGTWMDQQLKIGYSSLTIKSQMSYGSVDVPSFLNEEEGVMAENDQSSESNSELLDAVIVEQRRAYKLEMQKGISLFNKKPFKGVEFLIKTEKVDESPEAVAFFLKNTVGLNLTVVGDYLGEPHDFPSKVMHAFVDGFNFEKMDFGEAIRYFLRDFRLPGEAQKIDRIMEKFAERYCKCNPNLFKSADTAYVLAYSAIMLNTYAHNNMVKDKMTKDVFIWNNRGIDDGKDLSEEYLGALYDQIVKNEINMNAANSQPQSKNVNELNRLLGLDGILNLVMGKQAAEKPMWLNELILKDIQEQFKAKSGKSESVFCSISDVSILRFMAEVCWSPMLAAFSKTLDKTDEKLTTLECLQGFRYSVHVIAALGMQTQRDALVTTLAKFTYLQSAVDMKQKNVDAMKTIMAIAIENGNFLQEAWEHILTCLSRYEHLQLLGEAAPPNASLLNISNGEAEQKSPKSTDSSPRKKGASNYPTVVTDFQVGSYNSNALGGTSPKLVTPEEVNNFISNLHFIDQIGCYELNHIFAHSQRLNSEAIVSFVRALCKVSMSELQSPTGPRVFSLIKIVEIAHYNMNRIRLVWSRIWNVLSDFFVSVGLSENLSVAIFVIDSLRQLAIKYLEREELANYNFQNEFLRPFGIILQKSNSAEIRELIVRCISQMVLSRVSNVKSGWKSVFMVFTAAAIDERKVIVLLAFETMEKIFRGHFRYITQTESTLFTDCVRCLITFTNSHFTSDISINAISFLRFCAAKLAEEGSYSNDDIQDENICFWMPLLTGLSKLTSDPRSAIRKSALEVLFNILKDNGTLFSQSFWNVIFKLVIFPIFSDQNDKDDDQFSKNSNFQGSPLDTETSSMASECLVDLFVTFFTVVRSQLPAAVNIFTSFIKSPGNGPAKTGITALVRLTSELGGKLCEDDWRGIFMALQVAAGSTIQGFMKLLRTMDSIEIPVDAKSRNSFETSSDHEKSSNVLEDGVLQTVGYVVSRMKYHFSVQLGIIQVVGELFKTNHDYISTTSIKIILEIFSIISSHAIQLNSETNLLQKLKRVCLILQLSNPPVIHFQTEISLKHLTFLNDLLFIKASKLEDIALEDQIFNVCDSIFKIYLDCTGTRSDKQKPSNQPVTHWILPLPSAKTEELATRTPLLLSALRTLTNFEKESFKRYISRLFPLLVDLVKSEHTSGEVPFVLVDMFQTCIGPIVAEM